MTAEVAAELDQPSRARGTSAQRASGGGARRDDREAIVGSTASGACAGLTWSPFKELPWRDRRGRVRLTTPA